MATDDFDPFAISEETNRERAALNIYGSSRVSPDRAAEVRRAARVLNLPPETVDRNYTELQPEVRVTQAQRVLNSSPKTTTFLADENNAAVAHDQIDLMARLERSITDIPKITGRIVRAAGSGASQGVLGAGRAAAELSQQYLSPLERTLFGDRYAAVQASENRALAGLTALEQRAGELQKLNQPTSQNRLLNNVYGGLTSLAQNVMLAPLGAGGKAAPLLTAFGVIQGGQSYSEAREQGLSPTRAAVYGVNQGAAEVVGEKIFGAADFQVAHMFDSFGKQTLKNVLELTLRDIPGEMVTTELQNLSTWRTLNPGKSVADYIREQPGSLLDTAVQTIVGGGGQLAVTNALSSATSAAQRGLNRVANRAAAAEIAPQQIEAFDDVVQQATELPLRERDPVAFSQLMNQLGEGTDVLVPVEALTRYIETLPAEQQGDLITRLGIADQLRQGVPGQDIVIPAGTYLAEIGPTPAHAALRDDIKLGPQNLSVNEANAFAEERDAMLAAQAAQAMRRVEDESAAMAAQTRVQEHLLQQLIDVGRPRSEAEAIAAIQASHYAQRAARNTRFATAWDAYAESNPQIKAGRVRGAAPSGRSFSQSGVLPDGDHPDRIAQRRPSGKRTTENPFDNTLRVDLPALEQAGGAFEKNVALVRAYPGVRSRLGETAHETARTFIDFTKRNLRWLHDQMNPETRARAQLWYDGARALTDRWSDRYNLPDRSIAAVFAALSPQQPWHQNVSLAERVLDVVTLHSDHVYDDQMRATAAEIYGDPKYAEDLAEIEGQRLADLDDLHAGMFVRIFDQTYNSPNFRLVSPEGEFLDWQRTKAGVPSKIQWQSNPTIAKAVSVIRDPSAENISLKMGGKHKVRNFYNNILAPHAPHGDVTIDTHAVAAALIRPLGSAATEVAHNFGNSTAPGVPAASGNATTGIEGLYALYADAYREAGQELGLEARQLQSITWEAARALFTEKFKTAKNNAKIADIWQQVTDGTITEEQARGQIIDLAGGIADPDWGRSSTGSDAVEGDRSYEGKLPGPRVAGAAGALDAGAGGRAAGGTAGLDTVRSFAQSLATDDVTPTYDPNATPPTDEDGNVTLSHWSEKGNIAQLDPDMWGENWEVLPDEEKVRVGDAPGRVYWGVGTGRRGEYMPELGIGNYRYEAKVPLDRLYPLEQDPGGFRKAAQREIRKAEGLKAKDDLSDFAAEVTSLWEQKIKEAGYLGYWSNNPELGLVAATFEKIPQARRGRYSEPAKSDAGLRDFSPARIEGILGKTGWSIMTAENPMGQTLSPKENAKRNKKLEAELRKRGADFYPVRGHYGANEEHSYIVLGLNEAQALEVGRMFEQDSVLTRRGLVYHDGTYQPATGVIQHATAPEDFYTRVPGTGALFTIDIDFDQRVPVEQFAAEQDERGRITFDREGAIIELFRKADASTLVHEMSGHLWLEEMARDAADETASQELRDDWLRVRQWWAANAQQATIEASTDVYGRIAADPDYMKKVALSFGANEADPKIRMEALRPFHEMFARAAEQHIREGKAPVKGLQGAFTRLRRWLIGIYRTLDRLNTPINDEIRGVFDRLVAVPEAVEQATQDQQLSTFFRDAAQAGMTEAEFEAYRRTIEEANQEASDRLLGKVMTDLRRRYTAQWKEERQGLVDDYTEVVDSQPDMKVLDALENGDVSLNRGEVEDLLGADWRDKLYKRFRNYVSDDGAPLDAVAELAGENYTGRQMLADLQQMRAEHEALRAQDDKRTVRQARIDALADAEMLQRHGDILNDGRIGEEAVDVVNNMRRSEVLAAEVRALVRRAGSRQVLWTQEEMQRWAERKIQGMTVENIRPDVYERAEAKAGREAYQALIKDDFEAALDAKFRQLLNLHLYRQARDHRAQIDKAERLFSRIVKARNGSIEKTRNMDLVGAAREILNHFGYSSARNDGDYMTKVQAYDPALWQDLVDLGVMQMAAHPQTDPRKLTYHEFTGMADMVGQLWERSRADRVLEINGRKVELQDAVDELGLRLQELGATPQPLTKLADKRAQTMRQISGVRAALRRVEFWTQTMDGGNTGPFRRLLWEPVSKAADRYRVAKTNTMAEYMRLLEPVRDTLKRGKIDAPELGFVFGHGNSGVGKSELLHAILHTGNESNKRKLLLGYGWATEDADGNLDTSRWDAFVSRMQREGVLTKADYDFVQSIWDLLERMKPEAQRTHREVFGRYFEEITADEFDTPFGKYRGGYVPAITDSFNVQDAALRAEEDAIISGSDAQMFPSPNRGFTKSRVDNYTKPLALDLGLFASHIDKVLKFTYLTGPVHGVLKILKNREFSRLLESYDPVAMPDMLLPWLNRAAKQIVEIPSRGSAGKAADRFFRAVRTRTGMGIMMGNISNTLQQLTGFFPAALKVKKRHLAAGLWRYVRNPAGVAEDIAEMSAYMATRTTGLTDDVRSRIDDLLMDPTRFQQASAFAQRHAYILQRITQNVVDLSVWSGAFEERIEAGDSYEDAVSYADSVVRETQGSLAPEDISRYEVNTPFVRMFTQFYNYFNAQANLVTTEMGHAFKNKNWTRAFYIYLMGIAAPAFVADMIRVSLGVGPDEDGDGEILDDLLALFFGSQFRYMAGGIPIAGHIVASAANRFNDKRYDDDIVPSPGISTVQSAASIPQDIWKVASEGTRQKALVRDTATLMTMLTGVPWFNLAARPLGYLADINEGKVEPTSGADFARGLATGTASEASKTQ